MALVKTRRLAPKLAATAANHSGDHLFRGTSPSLWQFWKHGITSSFMECWLTCREQARLHYVEGWNGRSNPLALEFGSCMHWVFEQAYGRDFDLLRRIIGNNISLKSYSMQMIKDYEKLWLEEVPAPSQKQLEQQEHAYGLAAAVLPHYFKRWNGDFLGGKYSFGNQSVHPVKWVSLEELFQVEYTFPDGRTVPIRGRRDGVFLDKAGNHWIFDTKCRSIINDNDILDTMPCDFQQMLYLWVTHEQLGIWPKGCVVNIPRRPGQRQLKHETSQGLLERVEKEVGNPKNYDHYFMRFQMAISPNEILAWKKTRLDPTMADTRGWWEGRHPHYPTDKNLITKYGRAALFIPITKGEFYDCYKRDRPFAELREVA